MSVFASAHHRKAQFSHLNRALHLPGFCHLPSEGSVLHDRLPHVLPKSAYLRNQFPSSNVNFRSFLDFGTASQANIFTARKLFLKQFLIAYRTSNSLSTLSTSVIGLQPVSPHSTPSFLHILIYILPTPG